MSVGMKGIRRDGNPQPFDSSFEFGNNMERAFPRLFKRKTHLSEPFVMNMLKLNNLPKSNFGENVR